jgi:RecA-family ATPase
MTIQQHIPEIDLTHPQADGMDEPEVIVRHPELATEPADSRALVPNRSPQLILQAEVCGTGCETNRKRFRTVRELYSTEHRQIEWLVPGILPNESLISIQGRPKCGKSTFVFAMIKALVEGEIFLGNKLGPIKVVYLSEQNRVSFCQQLSESGIEPTTENMSVMTAEDFHQGRWDQNFDSAQRQLLETQSRLLVVDSWGKFSNFSEHEDEYQSGPTHLRVNKLRHLIGVTGATVLIIHHTGKQGNRSLIDAGLGATALAAQVDQAFALSGEPQKQAARSKDMPTARHRCLMSAGRFTDAITDIQIERLEDATYRTASTEAVANFPMHPPAREVLEKAYAANPEMATYGNQKLSIALRKMDIHLSERQIVKCRQEHPELRRT